MHRNANDCTSTAAPTSPGSLLILLLFCRPLSLSLFFCIDLHSLTHSSCHRHRQTRRRVDAKQRHFLHEQQRRYRFPFKCALICCISSTCNRDSRRWQGREEECLCIQLHPFSGQRTPLTRSTKDQEKETATAVASANFPTQYLIMKKEGERECMCAFLLPFHSLVHLPLKAA